MIQERRSPQSLAQDGSYTWTAGPNGDITQIEAQKREKRVRKIPPHLQDYVCCLVCPRNPSSTVSHPHPNLSSRKPYPTVRCVACDKFSDVHRCYLATIDKILEHRFFHEAVKDPKWREAIAK